MTGVPQNFMGQMQEQYSSNAEQTGGVKGIDPELVKFKEGSSFFRPLPAAARVEAIIAAMTANDPQACVNAAADVNALCRAHVYMPARSDDAHGISLFREAFYSCDNQLPGQDASARIPDPIDRLLEDIGVKWEKQENLDARGKCIRAASRRSDRYLIQVVNKGINGSEWQRGVSPIGLWMPAYKDFDEKFKVNVFDTPFHQGFISCDPFWKGVNMQISRSGKNRDTKYVVQMDMTSVRGNGFGSPLFEFNGQHDLDEAIRVLNMVKPWDQVMQRATPQQLEEAWKVMMERVDQKFMTGAVSMPGMGQQETTPPTGNTSAPPVNTPQTPPNTQPGEMPATPPNMGMPAGVPPTGSTPPGPPAGTGQAPQPPAFGTPGAVAPQIAPSTPPNTPNLGQQPPPQQSQPPQGAPVDPAQFQNQQQGSPPVNAPIAPPNAPPNSPPASDVR